MCAYMPAHIVEEKRNCWKYISAKRNFKFGNPNGETEKVVCVCAVLALVKSGKNFAENQKWKARKKAKTILVCEINTANNFCHIKWAKRRKIMCFFTKWKCENIWIKRLFLVWECVRSNASNASAGLEKSAFYSCVTKIYSPLQKSHVNNLKSSIN